MPDRIDLASSQSRPGTVQQGRGMASQMDNPRARLNHLSLPILPGHPVPGRGDGISAEKQIQILNFSKKPGQPRHRELAFSWPEPGGAWQGHSRNRRYQNAMGSPKMETPPKFWRPGRCSIEVNFL